MPTPDLPIIQSLWIGDHLSVMERLCIESFLAQGHTFHLYTYGDVQGVPDGTVIKDGRKILAEDRIFVYKKEKSYAGFANLFRYKLILECGGFWVDMDVVCLRPYRFKQAFVIGRTATIGESKHPGRSINNSTIGANPGHEFLVRCFEFADRQNPEELVWGQTGPDLASHIVHELDLYNETMPEYLLSGHSSSKYYRALHPKPAYSLALWYLYRLRGTYSVHLYHDMWRRHHRDKKAEYPRHTMYERLKRKYGVT